MKFIFSFLMLVCFQATVTAQNLTYEFTLSFKAYGDTADLNLKFCETPNSFAGIYSAGEFEHKLVADKKNKKMLELFKEREGDSIIKQAYVSAWDSTFEDAIGLSKVYEMLISNIISIEDYELLPEKKIIQGFSCQKVKILDETLLVGEGWIALGLVIGINKDFAFMHIPEGTFISLKVSDSDRGFELKLDKFARVVANPAVVFSMEVPSDYVLEDFSVDVDDAEEEDQELEEEEE